MGGFRFNLYLLIQQLEHKLQMLLNHREINQLRTNLLLQVVMLHLPLFKNLKFLQKENSLVHQLQPHLSLMETKKNKEPRVLKRSKKASSAGWIKE